MAGEPEKNSSCGCDSSFVCNICLDPAKEPVVTCCGHLFCWPCLYRWLKAQAPFSECPLCKGEVQPWHTTPIYGRGGEEGESSPANPGLPPWPPANRRESLSNQQLQVEDLTELASQIRRLIQNHPTSARAEMTSVPAAQAPGTQRLNVGNVASGSSNQNQQSSSVEQLSTSSTAAPALGGEPGPSRRSRRRSETPTVRRTRRPQ